MSLSAVASLSEYSPKSPPRGSHLEPSHAKLVPAGYTTPPTGSVYSLSTLYTSPIFADAGRRLYEATEPTYLYTLDTEFLTSSIAAVFAAISSAFLAMEVFASAMS